MEKKQFWVRSDDKIYQALLIELQSINGAPSLERCYGFISYKDGLVIEFPSCQGSYDRIMRSLEPQRLSALADEVANTISDKGTRDAFKRFADLLIEKVEKK